MVFVELYEGVTRILSVKSFTWKYLTVFKQCLTAEMDGEQAVLVSKVCSFLLLFQCQSLGVIPFSE